jgi:hypothetical protein
MKNSSGRVISMATKISVSVDDETMKRIDDYRYGNRIKTMQIAVLEILQAGLQVVDGIDGRYAPKVAATEEDRELTEGEDSGGANDAKIIVAE